MTTWQSREQHLHWIAAGDQLPERTPDWVLDHLWPSRTLHRVLCWWYDHQLDTEDGVTFCIWCQTVVPLGERRMGVKWRLVARRSVEQRRAEAVGRGGPRALRGRRRRL